MAQIIRALKAQWASLLTVLYRSRSAAALLDLPILDHVEILRGPQSTLFGKNVSAGAISVSTKKPEFEWGGSAEVSYGNFDAMTFKGSLTGPISDQVAFRISGSTNNREGYYDNVVDGSQINERDRWGTQLQLLWEPTDNASFRLTGDYNKIDEACCGAIQLVNAERTFVIASLGRAIDAAGDDDYSVAINNTPQNELEGKGVSLHADWDVGFGPSDVNHRLS